MHLKIKKIDNTITKLPVYGSDFSAGLDISSSIDIDIPPKERRLVSTGIAISWSGESAEKYYLRVAPRSGLSVKKNIDIGAGVVDFDYRGEIFVCFINNDNENVYSIQKGDRIAQLILTRIEKFNVITIEEELDETTRGNGGFGSTGI